jgi:hypothetical protein
MIELFYTKVESSISTHNFVICANIQKKKKTIHVLRCALIFYMIEREPINLMCLVRQNLFSNER